MTLHGCRGFLDSSSRFEVAQSLAQATDKKIVIAAETFDADPTRSGEGGGPEEGRPEPPRITISSDDLLPEEAEGVGRYVKVEDC